MNDFDESTSEANQPVRVLCRGRNETALRAVDFDALEVGDDDDTNTHITPTTVHGKNRLQETRAVINDDGNQLLGTQSCGYCR